MRGSLMTLVGAATLLTANLTGASNVTGEFQCIRLCLAGPRALAYLAQADWQLNLVNEAGVPSCGWIDYPVTSGQKHGTKARSIRPTA